MSKAPHCPPARSSDVFCTFWSKIFDWPRKSLCVEGHGTGSGILQRYGPCTSALNFNTNLVNQGFKPEPCNVERIDKVFLFGKHPPTDSNSLNTTDRTSCNCSSVPPSTPPTLASLDPQPKPRGKPIQRLRLAEDPDLNPLFQPPYPPSRTHEIYSYLFVILIEEKMIRNVSGGL